MSKTLELLEITSEQMGKRVSQFSKIVILDSRFLEKEDSFEFNLFLKGSPAGPVSGVKVTFDYLEGVNNSVNRIADSLLEGYVKYLESGFLRNRNLKGKDLVAVPDHD